MSTQRKRSRQTEENDRQPEATDAAREKAKNVLKELLLLKQKIETNQLRLEKLSEMSKYVSSSFNFGENIRPTGPVDRVGDIVAKIIDIKNNLLDEINSWVDMQRKIQSLIDQVEDEKLKLILTKRYLNFQKWSTIADDLDNDMRWVLRLHNQALEQFAKKI